jgi:hypothetical protein
MVFKYFISFALFALCLYLSFLMAVIPDDERHHEPGMCKFSAILSSNMPSLLACPYSLYCLRIFMTVLHIHYCKYTLLLPPQLWCATMSQEPEALLTPISGRYGIRAVEGSEGYAAGH